MKVIALALRALIFVSICRPAWGQMGTHIDSKTQIFTEAEAIYYSDSFTLTSVIDGVENEENFQGGGNTSFALNHVRVGVKRRGWQLSLLARYDYQAQYTPDTVLIYVAGVNDQDIKVDDGLYNVDLNLQHMLSYGVGVGYRRELLPGFNAQISIDGLASRLIADGRLSGDITLNASDIESGALLVDYHYTEDLVLGRDVNQPTGHGFSTHLEVDWQATPRLQLHAEAKDLFSKLYWSDLSHMVADATTAIVRTDNSGLLIVRPTLQGRILEEKHTQEFEQQFKAKASYQLSEDWAVAQDVFSYGKTQLLTTQVKYKIAPEFSVSGEFEWQTEGTGVWVNWHGLQAGLTTSNFNIKDANYVKAGLKYNIRL